MQDLNWKLPYSVEKTFYAIRNLLNRLSGQEVTLFDEPLIYVVINQSIDALEEANILTETELEKILAEYRNSM